MRTFHKPLMSIFSPPKIAAPQIQTPGADAAAEQRAKDEASRKTRAEAEQRGGVRSTVLTGGDTEAEFKKLGRRTVLGVG